MLVNPSYKQYMNDDELNEIWDFLVKECGAYEGARKCFIGSEFRNRPDYGFKFIGDFGKKGSIKEVEKKLIIFCDEKDLDDDKQLLLSKAQEKFDKLINNKRARQESIGG